MLKTVLCIISWLYSFLSYGSTSGPQPWQINLQPAATPVMEVFESFHNQLLIMCFGIAGFVLCLILFVCFKFRKSANPTPSKTTHNVLIEVIWTAIPALILLALIVPSIKSLKFAEQNVQADLTLKVIGNQWYWSYEYNIPNQANLAFDSYIIKDSDLKPGQSRLHEVDNQVVLPIDTNIRILITARDVIHSWGVPAFGVKKDAIPGRTNETWMRITKPGIYFGHCYELCGVNHGFMPIVVKAVSKEEFNSWVKDAHVKFAEMNNDSLIQHTLTADNSKF
jgi:cytochrome c oxidase subunit 2